MVSAPQLRAEFPARVDRRVHGTPYTPFNGTDGLNDVVQRRVSNDRQVHIALGGLDAASDGTVDERNLDCCSQRLKGCAQEFEYSERLCQHAAEFGKERVFAIGLVVDLLSRRGSPKQPNLRQQIQFPLERSDTDSSFPGNLTQERSPVRRAVKNGEQFAAGLAKEQIADARMTVCSHPENNCTLFENDQHECSCLVLLPGGEVAEGLQGFAGGA